MLDDEPDMKVVGEAGDGRDAIELSDTTQAASSRDGLRDAGYRWRTRHAGGYEKRRPMPGSYVDIAFGWRTPFATRPTRALADCF